jgi:hypothetical protein
MVHGNFTTITKLHYLAPNIDEMKTASEKIWKFGQEDFPVYFKV